MWHVNEWALEVVLVGAFCFVGQKSYCSVLLLLLASNLTHKRKSSKMLKSVKDRYIRHLPSKNMSFTNMQYTAKPPRIRPITQTSKKNPTHLIYKDFANITNNNKSVGKSRKSRDLQSHKRKKKKEQNGARSSVYATVWACASSLVTILWVKIPADARQPGSEVKYFRVCFHWFIAPGREDVSKCVC